MLQPSSICETANGVLASLFEKSSAKKRISALLILQLLLPSLPKVSQLNGTHKLPLYLSPNYSVMSLTDILQQFLFWILCSSAE